MAMYTTKYNEDYVVAYYQEYLIRGNEIREVSPQYEDEIYQQNHKYLTPMEYLFPRIKPALPAKPLIIEPITEQIIRKITTKSKPPQNITANSLKETAKVATMTGNFILIIVLSAVGILLLSCINMRLCYRQWQRRKKKARTKKLTGGRQYEAPEGPDDLIPESIKHEIEYDTQARIERELRDIITRIPNPYEVPYVLRETVELNGLNYAEIRPPRRTTSMTSPQFK